MRLTYDAKKKEFREAHEDLVDGVPEGERMVFGADVKGGVGVDDEALQGVHAAEGMFASRNEGEKIVEATGHRIYIQDSDFKK